MKEHLTYGFHPEYDSRKQRLALIRATREAVRAWNEAMGFKVLQYQSEDPDIVVSEMTRSRILCLSGNLLDFIEKKEGQEMGKIERKLANFLISRFFVYGFFVSGLAIPKKNEGTDVLIRYAQSMTHELGHALGLPHSGAGSVMEQTTALTNPSAQDVEAVKKLISKSRLGYPDNKLFLGEYSEAGALEKKLQSLRVQ